MDAAKNTLEFGKDWKGMLNYLAESESLVDVYLCASAYGHADDREEMVAETHCALKCHPYRLDFHDSNP